MNIILVGLGGMGTVHYHSYLHVPGAKVAAAVAVSDQEKEKAARWGISVYPSITEACQCTDAQMVDICVPTFLHKQLVLESLANRRHTLVEKPIALHKKDAEEMFKAAAQHGVQLYVAQVLQFTREVEILRDIVQKRTLGAPLDACFERLSARPAWSQGSWLMDKEKSGLIPYDLHVHDLDVIVSAFGIPVKADYTVCRDEKDPIPAQYRFAYGFAGGLHVSAEAAWFHAPIPFTARWRVYFEKGMLIYDDKGLICYHQDGSIIPYDISEPVKIPTGINLPPTGMFLRELTHFAHCAQNGIASDRVPKEQVLAVLDVLEKTL